ncbi:MAG TPA: cation:proton antiporter [Longimicrobiales bacterium]|nr:cation:proton antiporter [Longimicrobiales bacterium]
MLLFAVLAAPENGAAFTVPEFLFVLVAILVSAKLFGELAEKIGQPAVLGELVAGVVIGASVLGILDSGDPRTHVIHLLADVGVILLLFQIGLETNLPRLLKVGPAAMAVAITGVVLPFALGYGVCIALGLEQIPAVVAGAALTATSVGITARVLSDLGRLQDPESQIVLGAAVIDDIIGLIILAIVAKIMAGGALSIPGIGLTTLIAFGFVIGVVVIGRFIVPPLFDLLSRVGREETLGTMALAFAFVVAFLADQAGSALIIGAFAAGLVLGPTPHAHVIEHGVLRLSMLFVPIFFVWVGAAVDVRTFTDPQVLIVGGSLIAVAIIGKFAAGYAPFWFKGKKSVIGVGMMPRGEVGLIFAQMGLTTGALTSGLFSALTLMVMVTTFLAPPLLKLLFPPREGAGPPQHLGGIAEITTEA